MFSLKFLPLLGLFYLGCDSTAQDVVSPILNEGGIEANNVNKPAKKEESSNNALEIDLQKPLVLTKGLETIKERVKYFSLRKSERVWEKIPWVTDFETAKALSEKTNRPIFLFSMWGELDGRC